MTFSPAPDSESHPSVVAQLLDPLDLDPSSVPVYRYGKLNLILKILQAFNVQLVLVLVHAHGLL